MKRTISEMSKMDMRRIRGMRLANHSKIIDKGNYYLVPSQTTSKSYMVRIGERAYCNCPDFANRGEEIGKCKHIIAVEIRFSKHQDEQGNTVLTQETKISYKQDWIAYDKSQTSEKMSFMNLLNDLCEGIQEPIHEGAGRPSLLLRDMVFVSAMKVYTTFSLRRFVSDMRIAQEKGFIDRTPHYSRVARYMENPKLIPIIQKLIEVSSMPLKSVESNFAVDSSGFSTSVFSRWFDYRYGRNTQEKMWFKAHIMIGVKTNVVTAVKVTDGNTHDNPQFTELLDETAKNFEIKEVSADKGYSSHQSLKAVSDLGATPYIPFRRDIVVSARTPRFWKKMYHYFQLNQEEFMEHYHKRSNVESTFSMIKRKFGGSVRSKTKTAEINEILCHNICVLIQEMNELDIEPKFII